MHDAACQHRPGIIAPHRCCLPGPMPWQNAAAPGERQDREERAAREGLEQRGGGGGRRQREEGRRFHLLTPPGRNARFDGGFKVPGLKDKLLELYNRTQPNAAVFNGCGLMPDNKNAVIWM